MTKVVYNKVFGGFCISRECAGHMAERGSKHAQEMIRQYYDEDASVRHWYGHWEGDRHDPHLVEAVEAIGFGSGRYDGDPAGLPDLKAAMQLGVVALKSDRYFIDEYDGLETVIEPQDVKWIIV